RVAVSQKPLPDDPYEAHFHRDPLPGAGVRVIVLDPGQPEKAWQVAEGLVRLLVESGREAEARVVGIGLAAGPEAVTPALSRGERGSDFPPLPPGEGRGEGGMAGASTGGSSSGISLGTALEQALADATLPLVLVTTAVEPWTAERLDPLLKAIDHCD